MDVTKNSESQQTFLEKVADDEPIFILRGRDEIATYAIASWINTCRGKGVNWHKLAEATRHLAEFIDYQGTHETKLPD